MLRKKQHRAKMAPTKTSAGAGATKSSAPQILYVSPEANRCPPFHSHFGNVAVSPELQ